MQAKRSDYIEWDPVPEAVSYEAQLLDVSTAAIIQTVAGLTVPEVLVGDLAANQAAGNYNVSVRTYDGVEYSNASPPVALEVQLPDYPTNIRKKV